jgi:predicted transcriptional regulator
MVEQLFGSKTRVKLLSLFLNNPNRPFYVREITRKIDEQINSVRRELSNLMSIGIIKSEGEKNRLYYEINQNYEYYKQLRNIFSTVPVKAAKDHKEVREEDAIAKKLRGTGAIELAFLTGSFVRDSRVNTDLFVVGEVNRASFVKVVGEMEKDMGRELNFTLMTPEEYSYRLSLNDRFLSAVVSAKKIMLVDGEAATRTQSVAEEEAEAVPVKIETPTS